MLGNILFVLVIIIYGFLVNLLLKPMPGGDYGVGYSFAWLIYLAGFIISTGLLVWNMNLNHCFDWFPTSIMKYRNWLVFLGWISFVFALIWSLEYHTKIIGSEFPQFMTWFIRSRVYFWLPLLLLIPSVYLINVQSLSGFAPFWVKFLIQAGFFVSQIIAIGILYTFGKFWVQQRLNGIQLEKNHKTEKLSDYKATLESIANYNESTTTGLLKFAHPKNDKTQREAATVKIKSFENWEQDLIDILGQKNLEEIYVYDDPTYFVYAFLDGNKMEHPEKFIQPIQSSLKVLNIRVGKSLDDPYNLELGVSDIELVCRVLEEQFKNYAKEFKPAMIKIQETLDIIPPERKNEQHKKSYIETHHKYKLAVNNWLKLN
ncbi:MAG: hypothetical protein IPO78_06450 [Saprospiraceae bacterium]|nr:hypothetical protein [Saprospiraceae bacterium]MBK9721244.1 hypothetical protein [Saprospiraceae bacterium]